MNYQTQCLIYHAQPYQIIAYLQATVTYFNVLIMFDVNIVSFTINFCKRQSIVGTATKNVRTVNFMLKVMSLLSLLLAICC